MPPAAPLALWGGVECTVNRVGNTYRDQLVLSGHHDRIDDLAAFAAIGIERLRYPVLWERVAPHAPHARDWRWSDRRLAEVRRQGMAPIAGLLHHGSGPAYTSLVDDDFPALFADFAGAVAARYPDILDWTPINEPLTTARFSALYGHWYPHARDAESFFRALLNQIDATRRAMAAIRRVSPTARLIQTEDLGETFSTAALADVARYYNDRRWLTWDLLCGRVVPGHPLWAEIAGVGLADRLRAIADDPCPPDVIGVNYYVTSDRYLDRDPAHGPVPAAGFHDHVAARAMAPLPEGLPSLLRQAHKRYGMPTALTECHIGCTRDEQLRWVNECWRACTEARASGIDLVAFTAWALTGSTDWDSLVTKARGHRETGAFALAGSAIRPTALTDLLTRLHEGESQAACVRRYPVLAAPGWWRRPAQRAPATASSTAVAKTRPLLIAGATGTLGRALAGACHLRGINYVLTDRSTMPVDDIDVIADVLAHHDPWAVINATGWVRIDAAEGAAAQCRTVNGDGAINLARACDARAITCVTFSSDQVFDGRGELDYHEHDPPAPLNVYGATKVLAEMGCLAFPRSLVVRTAAFFSPYDEYNFARHVERNLRTGSVSAASDQHIVSPTYVPHLVNACLDLLIDDQRGLWHLTNGESLSWFAFAIRIARRLGFDPSLVHPADEDRSEWRTPRPRRAGLVSRRGQLLPGLDHALDDYAAVRRPEKR
jgi:dTDP-4-dehydrorhamnose reductase